MYIKKEEGARDKDAGGDGGRNSCLDEGERCGGEVRYSSRREREGRRKQREKEKERTVGREKKWTERHQGNGASARCTEG